MIKLIDQLQLEQEGADGGRKVPSYKTGQYSKLARLKNLRFKIIQFKARWYKICRSKLGNSTFSIPNERSCSTNFCLYKIRVQGLPV